MILTTAPWRRALLASRRHPALLMVSLFAGLIVGVVASAPSLFVDATASGAVQVQWNRACPATNEVTVDWRPPTLDYRRFLTPTLQSIGGFTDPDFTASTGSFTVANGDRSAALGLLARSGFRDHIDVVSESDSGDLWLPDTTAEILGVTAGSTVTFGVDPATDPSFIVRGIYRDVTTAPLDDYWCTVAQELKPATLLTDDVPPLRGLIEPDAVPRFAAARFNRQAHVVVPFARPPATLSDARADAARTAELTDRLPTDVVTAFEGEFGTQHTPLGPAPKTVSDIDRLTIRATAVRRAVGDAIRPVALLAVASALALASVVGLMWVRVKRNDAAALATLGVSGVALGAKASLETALPMFVGGAAGAVVARTTLSVYAPSADVEPGTLTRATVLALVAAVVATVLVGVVAALASQTVLRHAASPARWWAVYVPWELALVAATLLAWTHFRSSELVALVGTDVAGVSTSALTFPLLLFVTGALVTGRLWMLALSRRRPKRFARVPASLAGRRLRFLARPGAALVACGVVAVAISVYGAGLVTSLSRSADAKVGLHTGSDVSFRVTGKLPAGTPEATQVARREKATYGGQLVDILAVDPQTFASVAFWDASFDDAPLQQNLDRLAVPRAEPAAPVLAIGSVPPSGQLTNTDNRPGAIAIDVVDTLRFFPGAQDRRPTIVMTIDDAERSGFNFTSEVWAKGTYERWFDFLTRQGVRPVFGVRATDTVNSSTLLFASWSFEFVRALGVFVGLQVVIALLLQIASRQRKQALAFGFLERMGLSSRRHWRALALEIGTYGAAMLAAGTALAMLAIRVVGLRLDPLPSAPPDPILVVPWFALAAIVLVGAVTTLAGTYAAQRLGRRLNVAEALRDDQ